MFEAYDQCVKILTFNIKHIVSYSISQGKLINLVAFVTVPDGEGKPLTGPTVMDVSKQELVEHFKGWEQEAQDLLDVSIPCIVRASGAYCFASVAINRQDGLSVTYEDFRTTYPAGSLSWATL